eukprot:3650699-Pyramimonas_sp.AAC.1
MPPKCITGRWGCTHECEQKMSNLPRREFLTVMRESLDRQHRRAAARAMKNGTDETVASLEYLLDSDNASAEVHNATMGLWAKQSIAALESPAFWTILDIRARVG